MRVGIDLDRLFVLGMQRSQSQDTNTTRVSVYLKNFLVDWCDQRAEQLGESRQAAVVEAVRVRPTQPRRTPP